MKKNKRSRILANLSSSRSGVSIGLSIAGAVTFALITTFFQEPWKYYDNWRIFIVTILSTSATVLIANIAWEVIVKKNFARDVVELTGLSENIRESGIELVLENFSDMDSDWESILASAKSIVAVFSYSVTWGRNQAKNLKKAHDCGCSFTVILPNYNEEEVIRNLKFRFGTENDVRQKIVDAIAVYSELGASVRLYNGAFTTSYYLVDDIGIIAPFNHQKAVGGHSPQVPVVKAVKSGFIYDFISKEVSSIMENSTQYIRSESPIEKENAL